jgi:hypothetical protein
MSLPATTHSSRRGRRRIVRRDLHSLIEEETRPLSLVV